MKSLLSKGLSIYVHYPFCSKLCTFCAFNKYVLPENLDQVALSKSYLKELDHVLATQKRVSDSRTIRSVYFGGGTPSLAPTLVADILDRIWSHEYDCSTSEVTLEANPTSLPKLSYLNQLGVTRVSLGIQSVINDGQLRRFNREHTAKDSLSALNRLVTDRSMLKDGFSFDLMFSNPIVSDRKSNPQNLSIAEELRVAIPYAEIGGHLSLYELTLEKGTPLARDVLAGKIILPNSDQAADEYETVVQIMSKTRLRHYEVSSFALPGHYSRHNFAFWMHEDLIGIGPGAHGRISLPDGSKHRTRCIPDPKRWAQQIQDLGHGRARMDSLSDSFAEECLSIGLRTSSGVSRLRFREATGTELNSVLDMEQVSFLEQEGYVIWQEGGYPDQALPEEYQDTFSEGGLRATERGLRVLDLITPMIIRTSV